MLTLMAFAVERNTLLCVVLVDILQSTGDQISALLLRLFIPQPDCRIKNISEISLQIFPAQIDLRRRKMFYQLFPVKTELPDCRDRIDTGA